MGMGPALAKQVLETTGVGAASGTVGAVVIGGDYQGLGIVRSLGQRGVPLCVVDDEHSISRFSRYCSRSIKLPNLREPLPTIENLLRIGREFGLQGWVLYPTREELVAAFSHYRSELRTVFKVPTPEWEGVKWAWDKRNTYKLAQELNIPTPITHYPENVEQLMEIDHLAPPFALKPAIKEHFFYATRAKAWLAKDHSELKNLFQKASEIAGSGEIMVQEVIPGGGTQQYSYCAFFRDGRALGKMVARRRRQHPLQFGRATTYAETVDAPIVEELSERFLRAINYYGLVEVEFKLDPRDSQYKLLDVNARTWGFHSLGLKAGVDFSYMLYADQVGLPVECCKAQVGVSWVRMTTDVPAAAVAILKGDTSSLDYFRSLRGCKVEAVYSFRDPLPGLAEVFLLPYLAIKKGF
jgi:D-aspartate ligase